MTDPNTFINVHQFDGKLRNIFRKKENYTIQQKEILFASLAEQLKNDNALKSLHMIVNDMKLNEKNDNYQSDNDLEASDILADILSHDYKSLLPILSEQLADISLLGICNSGRCTRLLQVWISLQN